MHHVQVHAQGLQAIHHFTSAHPHFLDFFASGSIARAPPRPARVVACGFSNICTAMLSPTNSSLPSVSACMCNKGVRWQAYAGHTPNRLLTTCAHHGRAFLYGKKLEMRVHVATTHLPSSFLLCVGCFPHLHMDVHSCACIQASANRLKALMHTGHGEMILRTIQIHGAGAVQQVWPNR
jgi:hypothetical protein